MQDIHEKLDAVILEVQASRVESAATAATLREWRTNIDRFWAERWPAITAALETLTQANQSLTLTVSELAVTVKHHENRLEELEKGGDLQTLGKRVTEIEKRLTSFIPSQVRGEDMRRALIWAGALVGASAVGALVSHLMAFQ